MKKSLIVVLLLLGSMSYAQDTWINKEVGNNIFVKFPNTPTYKSEGKAASFVSKTKNCLFMVIIQFSTIPYYHEFVKLPVSQRNMHVNQLLDNYVKGRGMGANKEIFTKTLLLDQFMGRELRYSAVNPADGKIRERFSRAYVVVDKIYSFECWYLNNSKQGENEKNIFLASIASNR